MDNQEQNNTIKRISLASDGTESNGYSDSSSISDDGRYIVFSSNATNLVPNDTNNSTDTFIYDRSSKTVELINIAPDNTQANASVSLGSMSGNGRYITFASAATNLVANDTNQQRDIFVYDRVEQTTERVSVASDGTQANNLNLFSAISDDGRYVAFESMASNLVADDTNQQRDIFIYDRVKETTERVSVSSDGTQANDHASLDSIGDNGRYITFSSSATNLVAGDTNEQSDVFVYDRILKTTERVSVSSDGTQANNSSSFGSISGDGRYVAFESTASNLVANDTNQQRDVFVYDRVEQTTERVSMAIDGTQPNGSSYGASIGDDGRYVAFLSEADNLVTDDINERADIFIYDRVEQTTKRFNGDSFPSISGNSQYVVFNSSLNNLVANDTNQAGDVFLINSGITPDDSETNEPEASQPEASQPETSEPEVSEPEVSEPETNEPEVSEPEVSEPETNEPETSEPEASQPETSQPETSQPEANEPEANEPETSQPETSEPEASQPETSQPETSQPEANEPEASEPEASEPEASEPEASEPEANEPETSEPETNEPEASEPETSEPETNEPETSEPETGDSSLDRFTTDEVHRFYQFEKGFHLYTIDDVEIDNVRERSASGELSYQYEAEKFRVLSDDKDALTGAALEGVEAVYRFFNTDTGAHLYTTDEVERAFIEENLPNYNAEGIKYHAFESQPEGIDTIPVFRLLNTDTGSHLYTIDQNELNFIQDNLSNFTLENNGEATFYVFDL